MVIIKELRTKKGMTQRQLADESGITLRTIQRIENGDVNPSLHSLKILGKVLEFDLSSFHRHSESKPYEFNFTIKITDMNQLFSDIKILIKNNWKILIWIVVIIYAISNYTEIKTGIIDGWNSNKEVKK